MRYLVLISTILLLAVSCGNSDNVYIQSSESSGYGSSSYEPENPYSSGTGHSAGYDWAERTGGDCNGNSSSFNEGCEEYYNQQGY